MSSWGSSMFAPGSSIKGREEPKAGAGSRRERRQEEG